MSFKDGEMHTVAAIGACALTAALCVPTVIAGSGGDGDTSSAPLLEERTSIAASIAKQSKPKPKLPEKEKSPPPPEVKPDGINRDLDHIPDPKKDKKPDQAKQTPDPKPNFDDFRREDPDNPTGEPVTQPGPFNENEKGFADITTGHPYFRALAAQVHGNWSFPGILESKSGAEGCLHILADGKIAKIKVDPRSGDATFDDAVEGTMKKVEALRNAKPEPVPADLVREATTKWICFNFKPEKRAD
jgi:hypothetical protein